MKRHSQNKLQYLKVQLGTLLDNLIICSYLQGFFQGNFKTVKRPQKLILTLSFETQSSHQNVQRS